MRGCAASSYWTSLCLAGHESLDLDTAQRQRQPGQRTVHHPRRAPDPATSATCHGSLEAFDARPRAQVDKRAVVLLWHGGKGLQGKAGRRSSGGAFPPHSSLVSHIGRHWLTDTLRSPRFQPLLVPGWRFVHEMLLVQIQPAKRGRALSDFDQPCLFCNSCRSPEHGRLRLALQNRRHLRPLRDRVGHVRA